MIRQAGFGIWMVGLLMSGAARADAIDGNWCRPPAKQFSIRGPAIVTPGGTAMQGNYDRHRLMYVVAPNSFMFWADCQATEPADLWHQRRDARYRDRLPGVIADEDGVQWRIAEGYRPTRLVLSTLEGEDAARNKAGATAEGRLADHD